MAAKYPKPGSKTMPAAKPKSPGQMKRDMVAKMAKMKGC